MAALREAAGQREGEAERRANQRVEEATRRACEHHVAAARIQRAFARHRACALLRELRGRCTRRVEDMGDVQTWCREAAASIMHSHPAALTALMM